MKKRIKRLTPVIVICTLTLILSACRSSSVGMIESANQSTTVSVENNTSTNITDGQAEQVDIIEQGSNQDSNIKAPASSDSQGQSVEENQLIEVAGGDQSGHREPNVVVDIGYGDREYYAYTNEYGQLVRVTAKKIVLQDESREPVLSTGRYYSDEAKVPGVESKVLDEGHVIADSLGGVSNAYNITPQESTLNRHGDQAYMEKMIREAGGCTDFVAVITYPNTETQIPSHYSYTYKLKGNVIHDEFDNVNPDQVNAKLERNISPEDQTNTKIEGVAITALDKKGELITISNTSGSDIDITGWKVVSVRGNQEFIFPSYILKTGISVTVGGFDSKDISDFDWEDGRGIWNNSKSDPAELYDSQGNLVSKFDD